MRATVLDLRRRMPEVLRALERNENVVLLHRGVEKGIIVPSTKARPGASLRDHPAFGMWRNRRDMRDPTAFVAKLRRRARHAL